MVVCSFFRQGRCKFGGTLLPSWLASRIPFPLSLHPLHLPGYLTIQINASTNIPVSGRLARLVTALGLFRVVAVVVGLEVCLFA